MKVLRGRPSRLPLMQEGSGLWACHLELVTGGGVGPLAGSFSQLQVSFLLLEQSTLEKELENGDVFTYYHAFRGFHPLSPITVALC